MRNKEKFSSSNPNGAMIDDEDMEDFEVYDDDDHPDTFEVDFYGAILRSFRSNF